MATTKISGDLSFFDGSVPKSLAEELHKLEKPSAGISKDDLEGTIKQSLDKADSSVAYNDVQNLTAEQKRQAQANIGISVFVDVTGYWHINTK